jgi:hypothetical protein
MRLWAGSNYLSVSLSCWLLWTGRWILSFHKRDWFHQSELYRKSLDRGFMNSSRGVFQVAPFYVGGGRSLRSKRVQTIWTTLSKVFIIVPELSSYILGKYIQIYHVPYTWLISPIWTLPKEFGSWIYELLKRCVPSRTFLRGWWEVTTFKARTDYMDYAI